MITKLILMMLLALCTNALVAVNNPFYCFSRDPVRPQMKMFGPTTSYEEVRNQLIDAKVSACTPSRFWYQGRHGMRFPSVIDHDNLFSATDGISSDILKNYYSSKTTLCSSDAELIKNWKFNHNFNLPKNGDLTASGWTELANLGSRFQKAFPTLLPKLYTSEHYYFRHSPVPRTLESARAFAEGLFGLDEHDSVKYEGHTFPDPYLLPFNSCPVWFSFFKNVSEAEAFTKGTNYQQMIKQVSEKLGFFGSQQLNASIVDKLLTHCKYEQILNPSMQSAFCSVFFNCEPSSG